MADYEVLDAVRLRGESVGTLTRLGHVRIVFAFDPRHADDPAPGVQLKLSATMAVAGRLTIPA